ncbi:MAG: FMN-binding negative transcriptional regulator [Telluria sp.]
MYVRPLHAETRPEVLHELIARHPLGALVTQGEDGPDADHVPFLLRDGRLLAHVARANPVWQKEGQRVLVIFRGQQGYISPSLYDEKAASGRVVPTWNYSVVHVHGILRRIDDRARTLGLLRELTAAQEEARAAPWAVDDAPADFVDRLLDAIVGIEVEITRMTGKCKMSQDHGAADRARIDAEAPGLTRAPL